MYQLSKFLVGITLNLLLGVFLLMALNSRAQNKSYAFNYNNNKTTIKVKNGTFGNFSINYEGEITLSNNDKDVVAISDGGYLEIKKSAFGSKRRILIESDGSGRLIKKYYVGSSKKDFESEGRKWLGEILPEVVRTTAIGAKGRLERFYNQGGATAVFNEIRSLESDYVKSTYLKLFLEKNLSSNELESLLRVAGEEIDSDHYLTNLLKYKQKNFFASSGLLSAYIDAAKSVESDHYVTVVLNAAIENGNLSDSQVGKLFDITKSIGSDHYMSQVLINVMKERELNNSNLALLIDNSKQISSDHYKSQVLIKALDLPGLSEGSYKTFLSTLEDIDSDHYVTVVFDKLLDKKLGGSDLNQLMKLAGHSVGSDHYLTEVLSEVIDKQGLDGGNLDVFINAMSSISSDHYATVVMKKLARENLNDQQLIKVLGGTNHIASDHYLSSALVAFAPSVKKSGNDVKEKYRNACKSISSETYYGRAIRAIE